MSTPSWPVAIEAAGGVAVGTTLWRFRNQLRVTVVCKATFTFAPDGTVTPSKPLDLRRAEVHGQDDPRRSIVGVSDLAPRLLRADVLFVGHAWAIGGRKVGHVPVRLMVARGDGTPLFDKRLDVYGDRTTKPGEVPTEPQPFTKMPLVYERAYGGIGWADNPIGVGVAGDGTGRIKVPNVVHPAWQGGGVNPPGFAPISSFWPARRRLLGTVPRRQLEAPVGEIPDELDWNYFQAAPFDQRVDFLQGDEWIVLEGLHPEHAVVRTRLPGAKAGARVTTRDGIELPLKLRADTLAIHGDAERCTVTWRGNFPVPDLETAAGMRAVAGIELPGVVVDWPEPAPLSRTQVWDTEQSTDGQPKPNAAAEVRRFDGTMTLDDEDLVVEEIDGEVSRLAKRPAGSPIDAGAPRQPPVRGAPPVPQTKPRGAASSDPKAPFPIAPPAAGGAVKADIPGAPWARGAAPVVPRPQSPFAGTMRIEDAQDAPEPGLSRVESPTAVAPTVRAPEAVVLAQSIASTLAYARTAPGGVELPPGGVGAPPDAVPPARAHVESPTAVSPVMPAAAPAPKGDGDDVGADPTKKPGG